MRIAGKKVFLALVVGFFSFSCFAEVEPVCQSVASQVLGSFRACFLDRQSDQLWIYTHGVFENETVWQRPLPQSWENEFRDRKILQPDVLVLSFGRVNFLSSPEVAAQEVAQFVSRLKTQYKRKVLIGDSMGGFNALQLVSRNPLFVDRVVLLCPALTSVSPFATMTQWRNQYQEPSFQWWRSFSFRESLKYFFSNERLWEAHSPLNFIKNQYVPQSKQPPILLGWSEHDQYGFSDLKPLVNQVLREKQFRVTNFTSPQRHCLLSAGPVVDFATKEENPTNE